MEKDESLNAHEINILNVLRNELDLSKREHYLLESRIGRFPRKGNVLHTHQQISRSLINLQTRGLILRFREDTSYYIIPKDIARILRYEMGGELRNEVYAALLGDLNVTQLREILNNLDFSASGVKEVLVNRIIEYNILPSTALKVFGSKELSDILRNLEGTKISGTKKEKFKILLIIMKHFPLLHPQIRLMKEQDYMIFMSLYLQEIIKHFVLTKLLRKMFRLTIILRKQLVIYLI